MTTDERDDELVGGWMKELADLTAPAMLPDAAQIWWKAQLLRRWDEQRVAASPLEVGERVQVATGLSGAAILLAWLWSRARMADADLASSGLMTTVAAAVLLLTSALAAGWWRPVDRS